MNAHPHTDDEEPVALVHNRIVENYQTLRDELGEQGSPSRATRTRRSFRS
jgi:glucosamine 6-phosphate synthetase-like amidotransferase/phosphosugar isomerase protein